MKKVLLVSPTWKDAVYYCQCNNINIKDKSQIKVAGNIESTRGCEPEQFDLAITFPQGFNPEQLDKILTELKVRGFSHWLLEA